MKQAKNVFTLFLLLFFFSLIILFFSQNTLVSPLQYITLPVQKWTFGAFNPVQKSEDDLQKLQNENKELRVQLAKLREIERDNKALHDQFAKSTPSPKQILPADIIGMQENKLFIDKGTQDNLSKGDVVIVQDNLVGSISQTSPRVSVVTLITDPQTSITATATKTKAIGVVKAQGNNTIFLDNVVLADKLEVKDIVLTKGDINEEKGGFPPNLVVGEIVSIKKKDSNLFQQAELRSFVDFAHLRVVFVVKK